MSLVTYLLTFSEGVLTFISPCILPMLPIYFLYLAGESGKSSTLPSSGKRRLVLNSIGFAIGFTIVFTALGATVTSLGHFLLTNRGILEKISGVFMIVFGLNYAGAFKIGFLNREIKMSYKFTNISFLSSILFGMVFGFGWTPCLGAFLGSALLLAGNSGTILQGVLLLLLYSLGLSIPFILSAIVFDKLKGTLKQLQKHGRVISIASGALLIVAGLLVFTGSIKYFSNIF